MILRFKKSQLKLAVLLSLIVFTLLGVSIVAGTLYSPNQAVTVTTGQDASWSYIKLTSGESSIYVGAALDTEGTLVFSNGEGEYIGEIITVYSIISPPNDKW